MRRGVQELKLAEDRYYFKDSVGQRLYLNIVDQVLSNNNDIVVIVLVALVNCLHADTDNCLSARSEHQYDRFGQALCVSESVGFRRNVYVLAVVSRLNETLHLDDSSNLVYVDSDL